MAIGDHQPFLTASGMMSNWSASTISPSGMLMTGHSFAEPVVEQPRVTSKFIVIEDAGAGILWRARPEGMSEPFSNGSTPKEALANLLKEHSNWEGLADLPHVVVPTKTAGADRNMETGGPARVERSLDL